MEKASVFVAQHGPQRERHAFASDAPHDLTEAHHVPRPDGENELDLAPPKERERRGRRSVVVGGHLRIDPQGRHTLVLANPGAHRQRAGAPRKAYRGAVKILYGVVGEGMGHAMRSRVVLEHLLAEGHEVAIMASGRAVDYLAKRFDGVNRIHGLHMIYEENRVRLGKTVWSNVLSGAVGLPQNIAAYFQLISEFRPEVAISDFESWTYLYAKTHRIPVISIDNMQIINRCLHGPEIIGSSARDATDFQLARAFVKGKLPFCDDYLITTFFRPPVRKEPTRLVPPIVRPEILAKTATRGDHLLVYQTAEGHDQLAHVLERAGVPCRVYGMRRDLKEDQAAGHLLYRPFSETTFIDDLASARGVVAGGGFTLMSECVYLRKPLLAVPLEKQFEQVLNARYLEKEGFGQGVFGAIDDAALARFLSNVPRHEENLARYRQDGNRELFAAVDEVLDRAAAGVS